jgi:heme/copper-type cytochrome/quinol oxidase subunit 2
MVSILLITVVACFSTAAAVVHFKSTASAAIAFLLEAILVPCVLYWGPTWGQEHADPQYQVWFYVATVPGFVSGIVAGMLGVFVSRRWRRRRERSGR